MFQKGRLFLICLLTDKLIANEEAVSQSGLALSDKSVFLKPRWKAGGKLQNELKSRNIHLPYLLYLNLQLRYVVTEPDKTALLILLSQTLSPVKQWVLSCFYKWTPWNTWRIRSNYPALTWLRYSTLVERLLDKCAVWPHQTITCSCSYNDATGHLGDFFQGSWQIKHPLMSS